jgi:hypothetical protein
MITTSYFKGISCTAIDIEGSDALSLPDKKEGGGR